MHNEEIIRESAKALALEAPDGWMPEKSAPKNGKILKLLVVPTDEGMTSFEDSLAPYETIGFNSLSDTGEDRWEFAGWDWSHDCFTNGQGQVIGWAHFVDGRPQTPKSEAELFEGADFFWRTMDPDDSGEYPQDAINRAGLGLYCVAEIASSFTGPKRYGFVAPVLELNSDEEEFLHFGTLPEAVAAAKERKELIEAIDAERECCIACEVPLEEGDLVYWDSNDTGYIHAACCGPEREDYVNADGEPLQDGEPIPTPFAWKPDRNGSAG